MEDYGTSTSKEGEKKKIDLSKSEEPTVPWVAFPCFTFFGIAINIGWHAVLSGLDYFIINVDSPGFSSAAIYNPIHNLGCLTSSIVSIFIGDKIHYRTGLIFGMGMQMIMTMLVPWGPRLGLGDGMNAFYFCMCGAIVGIFRGYVQGTIVGYSSMFPTYALGGMSLGQALSGLITSFVRSLSIIFIPVSNERGHTASFIGAVCYYIIAGLVFLISIVLFLKLENTDFARYHK